MGKGKAIGIGIGIVIALFFVVGIAASLLDSKENTSKASFFTASASGLLPQREDIGTEWVMNPESDPFNSSVYRYSGGFGTYNIRVDETPVLNAIGYQESTVKKYSKSNGTGGTIVVWPVIHKFDSIENATNYYVIVIEEVKEGGGYEEHSTSGLDANCYAALKQGRLTDSLDFYCFKANIYYHVVSSTDQVFGSDGMEDVKEFAGIIARKI